MSSFDKKYCYPDSKVLINKFDVRDFDLLNKIERDYSSRRYSQLVKNPPKGSFDIKHLKSIHKLLLGDVYAWAGQTRTVDISKGNNFCPVQNIESYLGDTLVRLQKEMLLVNTPPRDVPERLAEYFGDINAAHPFREGNGRTQRAFIELLGKVAGVDVDFRKTTEAEVLKASKDSWIDNNRGFVEMFKRITEAIPRDEQLRYARGILPKQSKALAELEAKKPYLEQVYAASEKHKIRCENEKIHTTNPPRKTTPER